MGCDNKWGVGLKPCFLSTNFYISVAFKINNKLDSNTINLLATKSIKKLFRNVKICHTKNRV